MPHPVHPPLFISHGSPTLILDRDDPAHAFLRDLDGVLGGDVRPPVIILVSAHWETTRPMVTGAAQPPTIHDFWGFPDALYQIRYPAPGAPEWADRVVATLGDHGIDAGIHPTRGLDHGAWAPLALAWPGADIPVIQLSIQPDRDAAWHLALGRALAPLVAKGALVIGSGSATHNLGALDWRGRQPPKPWAVAFADWLAERLGAGDVEALMNWRAQAPFASMNHPTDDHFTPLLVALGAALGVSADGAHLNGGVRGEPLHHSYSLGSLAMDAYRFSVAA